MLEKSITFYATLFLSNCQSHCDKNTLLPFFVWGILDIGRKLGSHVKLEIACKYQTLIQINSYRVASCEIRLVIVVLLFVIHYSFTDQCKHSCSHLPNSHYHHLRCCVGLINFVDLFQEKSSETYSQRRRSRDDNGDLTFVNNLGIETCHRPLTESLLLQYDRQRQTKEECESKKKKQLLRWKIETRQRRFRRRCFLFPERLAFLSTKCRPLKSQGHEPPSQSQ